MKTDANDLTKKKPVVTPETLATLLGGTADYVRELCRGGKLPAYKWAGHWYIHADIIGRIQSGEFKMEGDNEPGQSDGSRVG